MMAPVSVATQDRVEILRLLLLARRFDEALLAQSASISGHFHVSHGLEAAAVALGMVRRPGDLIAVTHRNHAQLLCIGHDPAVMLAEVLGRHVPPQLGRSGSLHLAAPSLGVPYTSAMVAGGIPQAVGFALAFKRSGSDGVSFCFFGDGAMQEGVAHECLNLASIWDLPIVFICENNANAVDGHANAYQAASSLAAIAQVHAIRARVIDGRSPRTVVDALREAVEEVRSAGRPFFLEVQTGTWPGNAPFYPKDLTGPTDLRMAAAAPSGETWYDRDDPVLQEARDLLADGVTIDELMEVDADVMRTMETAVTGAMELAESAKSLDELAFGDVRA